MSNNPQAAPANKLIVANGINARTGGYDLRPLSPEDFKKGLQGQLPDPEAKALSGLLKKKKGPDFAIAEGIDARRLDQAGWGIVFPVNTDPKIIDALRPLMDWRKQQAGDLYQEYSDNAKGAVRPMSGETYATWLARNGTMNYGPVYPDKMPYYLLLAGDPTQIDYRFQYQLDVQYAVGRICFDTPDEYARYAQSVVAAEKQQIKRPRKFSLFGVCNDDDYATNLSATQLVEPLAQFSSTVALKDAAPWRVQAVVRDGATKARLGELLGGADTPGLLLTASHGMGFPPGDPLQASHNGALLCQDWPGPVAWGKPIPQDFYFAADDLSADANLLGLIAFFFACYGAGTPQYDEFYRIAFTDQAEIAKNAFVAGLPKKMLSSPSGGALAVVGHVERAWGYSFAVDDQASLAAFYSALTALLSGAPIGSAFEYFNMRYAQFTADLSTLINDDKWNPTDPVTMANAWTATNDAKNYVVLGDPAVRACVAEQPTDQPAAVAPIRLDSTPQAAAPGGNGGGQAAQTTAADGGSAGSGGESAAAQAGAANYNILTDALHGASALPAAVQNFVGRLSSFLSAAIDSAVTLEIGTYTSPNMGAVKLQGGQVSGADLRALTVIRIDGDIQQVLPVTSEGEVDVALWNMHLEMVRQAQASRAELLRSAVASVASLVNIGAIK